VKPAFVDFGESLLLAGSRDNDEQTVCWRCVSDPAQESFVILALERTLYMWLISQSILAHYAKTVRQD